MNEMELVTDVPVIEMELDVVTRNYPVIPNPEGEATGYVTKLGFTPEILQVKDPEVHDWARAEEKPTYTKAEVGLGNVDNTSDLNKPISTATQTALDGKVDNSELGNYYTKSEVNSALDNKADKSDTYTITETDNLLSAKADSSSVYTKTETDTLLNGKVDKDGNKVLSDNNYSDTDKTKLDGIEAEANKTVVDNSVTSTSTNPVESKAIYNLLNDLLPEATATGNPIAITNASGLNAKSLKVELEPIQDLHGYDSPWVGGGGKNKHQLLNSFDTHPSALSSVTRTYTNGEVTISGTTSASNTQFYVEDISSILQSLGTATVSLKVLNGSANDFQIRINIEENGSVVARESIIGADRTYTYESTKTYYLLMYTKNPIEPNTNLSLKCAVQIESGNQATSYAPYSNNCPISGRTQTTVSVNSEDTTIQFGQTVYGGEVKSQGGTSNKFDNVDLGELNWTYDNTVPRFYTQDLKDVIQKPATSSQIANILVECYKSVSLNDIYLPNRDSVCAVSTAGEVSVIDRRFTSKDSFVQAISNQMLCYEKATPTTINTPAFNIPLNKGNNTIVGQGDMELIYSKTPQ